MPRFITAKSPKRDDKGWVQIAYVAKGKHPANGSDVVLTMEKFQSWSKYLDYIKSKGNTVPIASNHSFKPTDRLGTIEDHQIRGEEFWILPKWKDEQTGKDLKDTSFSIYSSPNRVTFDGNSFEHALLHVGATDYPVLLGLKKDLAASGLIPNEESFTEKDDDFFSTIVVDKVETPVEKKPEPKETKKMDKIAIALGLKADATEDQILAILKPNIDKLSSLEKNQKTILDKLVSDRKERVEALSCEKTKKALLKQCTDVCVLADIGNEDSIFEIALSNAEEAEKKEEEDDQLETEFQTGDQNGTAKRKSGADKLSLADYMEKEFAPSQARG